VYKELNISEYQQTLRRIFDQEQRSLMNLHQKSSEISIPKETLASEYPSMVQVGLSTICNMRCPECYYPEFQKHPGFQPVFMSQQIYNKILGEVSGFPASTMLRYLGRGESLTHPNAIQMLGDAKTKVKGRVALITNGLLMNDKKARELLETGIDVVDFSMDATTSETYSQVRGEHFDLLTRNVDNFINIRNQGNHPTRVMASFLIQPENYHEAEEFRDVWGDKVDKVIFRKYHSYAGRIQEKACIPEERHACASLWNRVNINENGKITLCYIDWDETSVITDLNDPETTILDTWRNSYEDARKGHLTGELPEICASCQTGWQAAHWQLSYEQAVNMVIQE
jgi:sulfatase maturation enzyme AslB (radical SAM superfamily)